MDLSIVIILKPESIQALRALILRYKSYFFNIALTIKKGFLDLDFDRLSLTL
jgi:hypothetical protein